jgi:hypothetical protein
MIVEFPRPSACFEKEEEGLWTSVRHSDSWLGLAATSMVKRRRGEIINILRGREQYSPQLLMCLFVT